MRKTNTNLSNYDDFRKYSVEEIGNMLGIYNKYALGHDIFEIKDKAKTFFQNDVCELMQEYILHRLSRVEDVLNGKITPVKS